MTAIIVTALGVIVAVPCMLPFLLERLLGTFWMAVMVSGCWAVLSLGFGLIHATLIQVIYLIFAAFWAWIAWRNRHKRRKLPTRPEARLQGQGIAEEVGGRNAESSSGNYAPLGGQ